VTVESVYPQSIRPKRSFRPCRRFAGGLCRFRRGAGLNTDAPETTQIRGVCGSVGFTDFPDFVRGERTAGRSAQFALFARFAAGGKSFAFRAAARTH